MAPLAPSTAGCSHCRKEAAPRPDVAGDSLQADSACHCHLTAPATNASFFNTETSETVCLSTLAFDTSTTPFVVVCSPCQLASRVPTAAIPDTSFRRIFLCVWLT
ncbi:hypothetical protein [Bremerella cremea]|uniref:hypothetical protein n=1 Tax=Bremerella cremea TaxID=1031537 RepID=UPI001314BE05|nr:hypothetical protein [Bremerella cremea]